MTFFARATGTPPPPSAIVRPTRVVATWLALPGLLITAGCGAAPTANDAATSWVGSIATEGDVTTVINEAGSVWGGPARLVEEASIGVLEGEDAYMFGRITSVTATADRILVADEQVPAVRMYDQDGRYLRDIGGPGEGPGEYGAPYSVRTAPDGRIFVRDDRSYVVHVYDAEGEHLETWNTQHRVLTFTQMTVTDDGRVVTWVSTPTDDPEVRRRGMQSFDADGPVGELIEPPSFDFEPVRVLAQTERSNGVRFPPQYPNNHWTLHASGRMVAGVAAEYGFEIRHPDGATTVVQKYWDRVPIPEQERIDVREQLTAWAREIDPAWEWDIPPIPEYKPAYRGLVAASSGEVWVLRAMDSRRMPDCTVDRIGYEECWTEGLAYDVFEPSGRFLGTVPAPPGLHPYLDPHIDGEVFVGVFQDVAETQYVKRYRLELRRE